MNTPAKNGAVPPISRWLLEWFSGYSARFVRRHFHAVRMLDSAPHLDDAPAIVYLNHPSWWDPLICVLLWRSFYADRNAYAPMDAEALEKYRFFKRLGFFPVRQHSTRGAVDFLRASTQIAAQRRSMLWVTPQSRFADPRERPRFKPGLAELALRAPQARCVPLAIEYVYWQERKPEVCLAFGPTVSLEGADTRESVNARLEDALAATQERLANAVISRDSARFRTLQQRASGVGGVYDTWRRLRAAAHLQRFQPQHGAK